MATFLKFRMRFLLFALDLIYGKIEILFIGDDSMLYCLDSARR